MFSQNINLPGRRRRSGRKAGKSKGYGEKREYAFAVNQATGPPQVVGWLKQGNVIVLGTKRVYVLLTISLPGRRRRSGRKANNPKVYGV